MFRCPNDNVANWSDIYLIQLNLSKTHFITIRSRRLEVIQVIPAQLFRRKNYIAGYSLHAMWLPSKDGKCNLRSRDIPMKGNSLQLATTKNSDEDCDGENPFSSPLVTTWSPSKNIQVIGVTSLRAPCNRVLFFSHTTCKTNSINAHQGDSEELTIINLRHLVFMSALFIVVFISWYLLFLVFYTSFTIHFYNNFYHTLFCTNLTTQVRYAATNQPACSVVTQTFQLHVFVFVNFKEDPEDYLGISSPTVPWVWVSPYALDFLTPKVPYHEPPNKDQHSRQSNPPKWTEYHEMMAPSRRCATHLHLINTCIATDCIQSWWLVVRRTDHHRRSCWMAVEFYTLSTSLTIAHQYSPSFITKKGFASFSHDSEVSWGDGLWV